jgi:hypothetical protein
MKLCQQGLMDKPRPLDFFARRSNAVTKGPRALHRTGVVGEIHVHRSIEQTRAACTNGSSILGPRSHVGFATVIR